MSNNRIVHVGGGGVGCVGMLTIVLIALKIMGYIDSWWVVFAPICGVTVIGLFLTVVIVAIAAWVRR